MKKLNLYSFLKLCICTYFKKLLSRFPSDCLKIYQSCIHLETSPIIMHAAVGVITNITQFNLKDYIKSWAGKTWPLVQ